MLKTFIPHVRRNGGTHAVVCDGCGKVCHPERAEIGGAYLPGTSAWFHHPYCMSQNRARGMVRWEQDQEARAARKGGKGAASGTRSGDNKVRG